MNLKKLSIMLFIISSLALLSACSTNGGENEGDANVEDRTGENGEATGENGENYEGQTGGYSDSSMSDGTAVEGQSTGIAALNDPNSPLSIRTIYFDYDSTTVNTENQSALNAHAEFLSLNSNQRIILEGHTDERGTREYNLSLGERRAQSIADFLIASGVSAQQLDVRSFGEENPIGLEQTESAWQLNRRVELVYQ